MAVKPVPYIDLTEPDTAATAAPVTVTTSTDTATLDSERDATLVVINGSSAGTLTVAAGKAPAKTFALGASKTVCVHLDSAYYAQSDGLIHLSCDQTVTAFAIKH